jgi:hypothetical protein
VSFPSLALLYALYWLLSIPSMSFHLFSLNIIGPFRSHVCPCRQYDTDKNLRLTWDEMVKFSVDLFGEEPPQLQLMFRHVKYQSSATQQRDAVDIVRLMKLLYMVIMPDGRYHPNTYQPGKSSNTTNYVLSVPLPPKPTSHPARFHDIVVAKFKKGKLLGQGGQGTVHMGTYDGVPCAGKTFSGKPDQNLVNEVKLEVDFFMKLDHPNCHYLLGAKTTLDNGGIITLTEVCDNGSLFNLYCVQGMVFDLQTAWRIGKECAEGCNFIHGLGYMHRDIKSL